MADNKVLIEFQIVQKGQNISVIQKETDKLEKLKIKQLIHKKIFLNNNRLVMAVKNKV